MSYLLDTAVVVAQVFIQGDLSTILVYYIGVSWLAWTVSLLCLMDESHKFSKWHWLQYTFFALATLGETIIAWLWTVGIYKPRPGTIFTTYDYIFLGIFVGRYFMEVSVFVLSFIQLMATKRHIRNSETSPLLANRANYGATTNSSDNDQIITTAKDENRSGYHDFWNKLRKVMPYIWPHNDRKLQNLVVICFLLMLLGLTINVYTPLQIGKVVDQFNREPQTFAWAAVCAYVAFKFLQGGSGLIQALQNWLWIPIGQFTTREISVKLFAHLHSLSLHYHINRKTGEVLRIVDRGTNSIVQLLSQIVFQIFPALANILIAVVVFSIQFSLPFGIIVFVTMSLYLYTTITLTEWRNSFRRKMNELDNFARTKAVDSLLNFETVKYYNAEGFEVRRYDNAIVEYQKADYKNSVSLNVLNLAQNAVITGGLLAGSLLFAYEVSLGKLTPGDFVSFNVYMMQLYTPLHFFGTYYRMIQQNFIDMEKMFDLFDVEETVKDAEGAGSLTVTEGHVKFDNVCFAYDNRQTALNGVSFDIPKGATVALVGPSGGGKSTILRLLFRFYDPNSGHIYIDGQDISQVKQSSLRQNIGVVPQDTVLFNDTIMYNIRYGRNDASDEDVYRAAKAAQIHDKILTFPDGYDTKVGERGLRLSGGEKQRVAIARTILKNPPVILLDEATSALDTTTERFIQEALSDMTKDRTTLVIAHRLSTIVNSDLILVIKDGKVVESGSHEALIQGAMSGQNEGIYYEMWQKQLDDHHDLSQTASGAVTPKLLEEVGTSAFVQEPVKVTLTEPSKEPVAEKSEEAVKEREILQEVGSSTATVQEDDLKEDSTESKAIETNDASEPSTDKKKEELRIDTTATTTSTTEEDDTAESSSSSSDNKIIKDRDISMTPVEEEQPEAQKTTSPATKSASQSSSKSRRNKKKKRKSKK
ncbi:mitochondrial ABC transporter ATM [Mucor circinelloides 1006PhL]|uniref:ATP-binding cassette sub-family B member 6 n=1 Tax=Mucor circinelloides f. circinelloides (strain 1006PhL) TaxID=1220926 RepID=S2JRQ6_MUCC1|nr:mitochondrial ABC transporter ATM [Mucor circinelloides 1006PhL]